MNIVSVDCGRKKTKVATQGKTKTFPSAVGGWQERELDKYGDYEVSIEGEKCFVGELAFLESHTWRENAESAKITEEFKILTLTAIATMGVYDDIILITAVPITQHNKSTKDAIVEMFKGIHNISINGKSKVLTIKDVLITVEGAGIYYNNKPVDGYCHILDIGSRTINMLTMYNNKFVNAHSYTLDYGCFMYEENKMSKHDFAAKIAGDVKKKWLDYAKNSFYIGGGGAILLNEQLPQHFSNAKLVDNPIEANTLGFYKMAVAKCQKNC
jgi:plasmid segregation protein ParM